MGYRYQTSLPAYHSILGDMPHKEECVWIALYEHGPMTYQELARYLNWPINATTPRIGGQGALLDKGLVIEDGSKVGDTGRFCTIWRAVLREPRPTISIHAIPVGKQAQWSFA